MLGQQTAIRSICNQIKYIELGINEINRPLGVFLFVGATGVGKTETAKQIAYSYFGSYKINFSLKFPQSEVVEYAFIIEFSAEAYPKQ